MLPNFDNVLSKLCFKTLLSYNKLKIGSNKSKKLPVTYADFGGKEHSKVSGSISVVLNGGNLIPKETFSKKKTLLANARTRQRILHAQVDQKV